MPSLLVDKGREFQRIRHSSVEKATLAKSGLQHVLSSNVSSIGIDKKDLIVRFHNGSLYKYPNKGSLYDDMLRSNSKGKFVWRKLRNTGESRIGSLPLKSDVNVTDEELFTKMDERGNLERLNVLETTGIDIKPDRKPNLLKSVITVIATVSLFDILFKPNDKSN